MKAELDPKRCFRIATCRRLRSLQETEMTALQRQQASRAGLGRLLSEPSPRTSLRAHVTFKFVSLKSQMDIKFSVQIGEWGG